MSKKIKLKRCPFCGNGRKDDGIKVETVETHLEGSEITMYHSYVICGHCAAQGTSMIEELAEDSISGAVSYWNGAKR